MPSGRKENGMLLIQHTWTIALLIWMGCLSPCVALGDGQAEETPVIQVMASDDRVMTVQVTAPAPAIQKISTAGVAFDRVCVSDWGRTSQVGYPELPVISFLIRVPDTGELSVAVEEAASEIIPGVNMYPVPEMVLTEDGEAVEQFTLNAAAYAARDFYPEKALEIDRVGRLRGTPVARVKIHPYQWTASDMTLRCYRNLRIVITFEHSLTTRRTYSGDMFEPIKQKSILNAAVSGVSFTRGEEAGDALLTDTKSRLPGALEDTQAETLIRIEVVQDGLYRVTWEELTDAGLPGNVDPGALQLYNGGAEAAIRVVPGSFIEFYGEGVNTQFTDTNVYWLKWGIQNGRRVASVDGTDTGTGTLVSTFYENLHVEENHTWWSGTPGAPDVDYWFWSKMTAPSTITCSLQIPSPVLNEDYGAMRVGFQGRSTAGPHHTLISLNDQTVSNQTWSGAGVYNQTGTFSQATLIDGTNELRIELPGDLGNLDQIYLNGIEIDYLRQLKAVSDRLTFGVTDSGPRRVKITGFSSSDLLLYDISDIKTPKRVTEFSVTADGTLCQATFEDQSSLHKRFWIGAANAVLKPQKITLWQSPNLKSTANGADWILITGKAFLEAVAPLVSLRQSQGLRTKAVAVEDLYNEFNEGIFDPSAIKAFLQYAYSNWKKPAPSYVLLAGDASSNYRKYLVLEKVNVVPAHFIFVTYLVPTDNWYVCLDGENDILPDMFIGRIPGSSAAMVSQEVSKITGFKPASSASSGQVLLVADNNEPSFETLNEALIPYLPEGFWVNRVYLRNYGTVSAATQDIIRYMDQGMMITNYVGHGSTTNWAGEFLFENEDVSALSNGNFLPFISAMTCQNGYFCLGNGYCLSEAFIAGVNRGAIGMAAPSSLGYLWEHDILDKELFSTIFTEQNGIMGSAVTQAKISAYGKGITSDAVQTFTLFGDPATLLRGDLPAVSTTTATEITFGSAESGGDVTSSGGAPVTARGVCWGQSSNPTTAGNHTSNGTGTGTFTSEITGLDPNTTYHYRAYASNLAGTAYGADLTFKAAASSGIAYVDGLDPTCAGQNPCFSTLQSAVDSPLVPHTIMVAPGTYQEHVVLENGREVVIEGSGQDTKIQNPVVRNGAVTCRNLMVIP